MPVPLAQQRCVETRKGSSAVTEAQLAEFKPQAPGWEIVAEAGISRLRRAFKFQDFASALAFTQKLGELAEREGHHPRIVLEWGRVEVTWWTHVIRNLHVNDFVAAAKTDQLYKQ
jgi:4a-hydroxytetrahydrobiopterin dehydratase